MECIFCNIINKKSPASVVYEDDLCLAFLDIYPVLPGHVLVIPKMHCLTLADCDNKILEHIIAVIKKLNNAVMKATKCDGILNELMNGEAAGQEIFHLHFHIIPRFFNDGFGWHYPKGYHEKEESRESLDEMARKIKNNN